MPTVRSRAVRQTERRGMRGSPHGLEMSVEILWLWTAVLQACFGHALTDAAFFDEVSFEPADLFVEEIVGLVDDTNGDVGDNLGRAGLHEVAIRLEGHAGGRTELTDEGRLL